MATSCERLMGDAMSLTLELFLCLRECVSVSRSHNSSSGHRKGLLIGGLPRRTSCFLLVFVK